MLTAGEDRKRSVCFFGALEEAGRNQAIDVGRTPSIPTSSAAQPASRKGWIVENESPPIEVRKRAVLFDAN